MAYTHALVWLDHSEAHVIHLDESTFEKKTVHSPHGREHLHHRSGTVGSGHSTDHAKFFAAIEAALGAVTELLVVGPASAKSEFVKHAEKHDPKFAAKLVAVESIDHPSDRQLVAYARKKFIAADRMRGVPGT